MKIKKLSDEQCLNLFLELLKDRVELNTHFVVDDEGNLTHQIIALSCGEYATTSQPEPLEIPLRPCTGAEQGATVN